MKKQIRVGVFETNSSSQHSVSIMALDKFNAWKEGKVLAKVTNQSEDEETWGNFWSDMYVWDTCDDVERAKRENEILLRETAKQESEELDAYKKRCLEHKPLVTKKLTNEEFIKLSYEEQEKYQDDEYEDSIYAFDEKYYNEHKKIWENITLDSHDFMQHVDLLDGFWITYEQYYEWFLKEDCYSPFNHDDTAHNVHIFGKYFHS